VTFCLTSLVPPPPLILSSLGLYVVLSPPLRTQNQEWYVTEDKSERLREIMM